MIWKRPEEILFLLNYGQKKSYIHPPKSLKKFSLSINSPVSFLQQCQNSWFSQEVLETGNLVADGVGKSYKSNINTANSHHIRTLARLRRRWHWEFTSKSILLSPTLHPSAPLYWRVYNLGNWHVQNDTAHWQAASLAPTTHETTRVVPGSISRKEAMDWEHGLYFQIPPAKSILELWSSLISLPLTSLPLPPLQRDYTQN